MTNAQRWERLKREHLPAKGRAARIRRAQKAVNEAVSVFTLPTATWEWIMEVDYYDQ